MLGVSYLIRSAKTEFRAAVWPGRRLEKAVPLAFQNDSTVRQSPLMCFLLTMRCSSVVFIFVFDSLRENKVNKPKLVKMATSLGSKEERILFL